MSVTALTRERELVRLATAGSVDDGKSTLIGRLLLDTGSLLSDHLDDVSGDGAEPDLAAITDGLRAEREQGITIDVAYRFFSTETRSFILADTPGHERYTRNMFTGASTADVAVVLIDARSGVVTQTRRHANIAALLGIEHMVVCVNKMDLVGWDQRRFAEIVDQVHDLTRRLDILDLTIVPISALHGDNVAFRSDRAPFHSGPTLLEYLEEIDVQADRDLDRLRLPIQWVGRPPDNDRLYAGRIVAGTLATGDEVVVMPAGTSTTVTSLDTLDGADVAVPPMSVTLGLADRLDVGRGDMLVGPAEQPPAAREIECTICWMSEEPLHPGRRYALKHTTRTVRATVLSILDRIDPETLERQIEPTALALNDIGQVTLRTSSPIVADPYAANRVTGALILIDENSNDTVAAGVIREARPILTGQEKRRDVTWHSSALDRDDRWLAIDQRGATVLLTGLSASGKSTIAVALERRLVDSGQSAYLLDGDNIRHGLSDDLGFTPGDRTEHIRRVGQVARLMADAGTIAVVSLISPLTADREHLRKAHQQANLPFVEVFVDTAAAGMRAPRPQGPLRPRTSRRDQGVHRHRRSLRASPEPRDPGRHRDHRCAGSRRADHRTPPCPAKGASQRGNHENLRQGRLRRPRRRRAGSRDRRQASQSRADRGRAGDPARTSSRTSCPSSATRRSSAASEAPRAATGSPVAPTRSRSPTSSEPLRAPWPRSAAAGPKTPSTRAPPANSRAYGLLYARTCAASLNW